MKNTKLTNEEYKWFTFGEEPSLLSSNQKLFQSRKEELENIDDIDDENIDEHFNNEAQPVVNLTSQYFSHKFENPRISNQEEEEMKLSYELGLWKNYDLWRNNNADIHDAETDIRK